MKYTKEQYEELINDSPLFDIDKDRDFALYATKKRELIERIIEYYQYYIFRNKRLEDYDLPLMEAFNSCLKSFDKSKGKFLHYFNCVFAGECHTDEAMRHEQDVRGGINIGADNRKKISAIIKLAKAKNLDLYDDAVRQKIAVALRMPVDEVAELIGINDDAVAVRDTVTNEDGDEVSLLDTVASSELSPQERVEREEELKAAKERVCAAKAAVLDGCRESSKPMLRDLITLDLIEQYVDGNEIERFEKYSFVVDMKQYECYSFYSAELVAEYRRVGKITRRMIYAKYGVLESSASRTYKDFMTKVEEKLKRGKND